MQAETRCLTGSEITTHLDDAARLRIEVFREYPYLYEGDADAERDYLASYARCPSSVVVLAEAGGEVVGVSTGLPLVDADSSFREPFERAGLSVAEWFYFGESVLDPAWRGRGVGHRFFDLREAHAVKLGYSKACFCAVERLPGHPLEPSDYRPHDRFWEKRGYLKQPGLHARFSWPQVDSAGAEVENELVFWTRNLPAQI
jgi:GNAT superfamily N-acetyltransferase